MAKTISLRCNGCGQDSTFSITNELDGDIERTWIVCGECGERYLVSVTDTDLRDDIKAYRRRQGVIKRMHKSKKVSPAYLEETERLHKANIARCNALKK